MTHRTRPALRPNRARHAPLAWMAGLVAALLLVAGCSSVETREAGPTGAGASAAAPGASAAADAILTKLGVSGSSATDAIDALDQKGGDRQRDILASVRYDRLVLEDASTEAELEIPDGKFYLSVAPYVNRTHECFYHSLTTCTGELAEQTIDVTIVDSAGRTLVDGPVQTYANGFVGFWLPRDIEGTITVSHEGRTATSAISTRDDAPTCLTTLRLA